MKKFFDMDSPIMSALSVAADLLVLNVLTFLCSLPVVTVGASLTALNAVCIRMIRGEGSSVIKEYFRSFRQNFKNGMLFGLFLLVVTAVLWYDYRAAMTYAPLLRFGIAAIAILVLAVALYAFPLIARYEAPLRKTIQNAVLLTVGYFPRTLLMLMFTIGLWLAGFTFVRVLAPVLGMFGFSLPCYVCCLLLGAVFQKLEENEKETDSLS